MQKLSPLELAEIVVPETHQKPMVNFKQNLMAKLAPTPEKSADSAYSNSGKKKTGALSPKSRTNSLRNGETSKVIQTQNLDIPIIDKEQTSSYQAYLNA